MNYRSIAIFSIKPQFVELIAKKEKNYEFRKYIPNREIDKIIVYTTNPKKEIKYILCVDTIIKYPQKIEENGMGNSDFNEGKKKSIFAYRIKEVYELEAGIPLAILKDEYGFSPPQRYIYGDNNPELMNYIFKSKKRKIV